VKDQKNDKTVVQSDYRDNLFDLYEKKICEASANWEDQIDLEKKLREEKE